MNKGTVPVVLALTLGLFFASHAEANKELEKQYFNSVMTILRSHIDALVQLTRSRSQYSDNVVRHAVAIHRTMGLFDHLDWTPERLARLNTPDEAGKPKAEQFNTYAEEARENSKKLVVASKKWLAGGDRQDFLQALNQMSSSCNQCHVQLRDHSAPILMTFNAEE